MSRRPGQHLDRFGGPLRAVRADDYRPAAAPPLPRLGQCAYGRDLAWLPRCTEDGRWRTPEKLRRRRPNGDLENPWVEFDLRCEEHKLSGDELVESELS